MTPAQRAAEPLAGHVLHTRRGTQGLRASGASPRANSAGRARRIAVRRRGRHSVEDRARGHHQAVPGRDHGGPVAGPVHRGRRAHGPGRPVRLRQDHGAAHGGRPGGDHRGHHPDRRPAGQRHGAPRPGHRDGVPELRAVPAPDRAGQHGIQPEVPQDPEAGDPPPGRRGRADPGTGGTAGPQAPAAVRRAAAAGGDGPGHRPPAPGVPDGRAAVQPGCQAPGADARRDRQAAAVARGDHDLRDPRPDRGDDAGQPGGRAAARRAPAGRLAAGALPAARQPVRGRLHRLPRDEPDRGDAGTRRRLRPRAARR